MTLILPQRGRIGQAAGGGVVEFIGWAAGIIGGNNGSSVLQWNDDVDLTSLTTDSYGIGGSLQENDLVVLVNSGSNFTSDQNATWSGYTEVNDIYANDTADTNLAVAYKFMGGTPDTSVDVSVEGYGNLYGGFGAWNNTSRIIALCFRGVDTTTPMDVTATTVTATNTGSVDAASITPVTPGALVCAMATGCQTTTVYSYTITMPGSVDYEQYVAPLDEGVSAKGPAIGWAMVDNWASGAVDIGTFGEMGNNFNTANESAAAITIALRPA